MLKRFDETISRFRADTSLHGQLKLGMAPALARRMLLRAIPSFQKRHPEIRLVLASINDPAQVGDEGIDVFLRPRSRASAAASIASSRLWWFGSSCTRRW